MDAVYLVQIQYDPTIDYGCGVDMTTRDTLHIASTPEEAQRWIQKNTEPIAQEYAEVSPWDLVVTPWLVNASWDEDKARFVFRYG